MRGRGAIAALTLAVLSTACAPVPMSRLVVAAAPAAEARLTLRLDDVFRAARSVLYVQGSTRVKVTIDGPGLEGQAFEQTVNLLDGDKLVTLEKVPAGTHRLVSVQALDPADVAIPGALLYAAGELKGGVNTLAISQTTTAVGGVVAELLATDREQGTAVLGKVDLAGLTAAMAGYVRTLKTPHWALLDRKAIAKAVYDANGIPPAAPGAFAVKPGRVIVRPSDFPPGARYRAFLNDPTSQPVFLTERKPLEIAPVSPGTWTLTLESAASLPKLTQTVTVTADGLTQAPVSFVDSTALPAMPDRLSAGAVGVVKIGAADTLVLMSGASLDEEASLIGYAGVLTYSPTGGWARRTPLVFDLLDAASAVHGSKLYFFGGVNGSTLLGDARRYDPATGSEPTMLDPLPSGLKVQGAVAGAVGDSIYITGGMTDLVGTLNDRLVAFNPTTGAFTTGLPAMPDARVRPASAVVDGKWYLFGGMAMPQDEEGSSLIIASTHCQTFTPGANPRWDDLQAMPTPRFGAGTVVVDGKIWVIGGATHLGAPSAAVEVYDPAASTWTIRRPLQTARANPACGYLNGKIIVAGGAMGGDSSVGIPLGQVEELKP